LEAAKQRGARVYAELSGCVSSCDAQGMYTLDPSGQAGARAIHRLLQQNRLGADSIDYVCAHANSAPAFDRKETLVLKVAFGEFAARMAVSSIKGVQGHPFGASGAFQVAASALSIRHEMIPPTHNLEDADTECELDHVQGKPRPVSVKRALVTSYGYGGVNAYLLVSRIL
jgi:3-oxoacyl-[acyl-carrier-protein] synthase II